MRFDVPGVGRWAGGGRRRCTSMAVPPPHHFPIEVFLLIFSLVEDGEHFLIDYSLAPTLTAGKERLQKRPGASIVWPADERPLLEARKCSSES